jgi:hypothetical protein
LNKKCWHVSRRIWKLFGVLSQSYSVLIT